MAGPSSDLLSGDYAQYKAGVDKAYQQSLAALNAQRGKLFSRYGYSAEGRLDPSQEYGYRQRISHKYDTLRGRLGQAKQDFSKNYGVTLDGSGGFTPDPNANGAFQRLKKDKTTTLGRITDARDRLQYLSGLHGTFDGAGNPTGTALSFENPRGDFQRLSETQARSLNDYKAATAGRGIGAHGLSAQALQRAEQGAKDTRTDFRDQLIDSLKSSKNNEDDAKMQFGREREDLMNTVAQRLRGLLQQGQDIDYQQGVEESDLGNALADALYSIQQQELQSKLAALINGGGSGGSGGGGAAGAGAYQYSAPVLGAKGYKQNYIDALGQAGQTVYPWQKTSAKGYRRGGLTGLVEGL